MIGNKQAAAEDILIVDDNVANLQLLTQMLSEQGFAVRAVTNGTRAITSAMTTPPNLILLDIRMPKDILDGYKGPKFGIEGIYNLLGIKERRPLLNCMIKPNCGIL